MTTIKQVPAHLNNYRNTSNRGSLALKTKKYGIVFHWIVGDIASADASFQNPNRRASAHFGVGSKGEIHQYVDEDYVAWHAGNRQANEKYLGIEMAGGVLQSKGKRSLPNRDCTNATIDLAVELCKRHGIGSLEYQDNAWRHNQVSDKYTGCSLIDVQNLVNKINKRLEVEEIEVSGEYYTVLKAGWFWNVWSEMFRAGIVDEYWAQYQVEMFKLNGANRYVQAGEKIRLEEAVVLPPAELPAESITSPVNQVEPVGEDEEDYNDVIEEAPIIDPENNIIVAEPQEDVISEEVIDIVETAVGADNPDTKEGELGQLDTAEDNLKQALEIVVDKKKQLDPSFISKAVAQIKKLLSASTVGKLLIAVAAATGIGVSHIFEVAADYLDLIIGGAGLLGIAIVGFIPKIKEFIKSKFKK